MDEDELDDLLDEMLHKNVPDSVNCDGNKEDAVTVTENTNLGLTFSFPGWGFDIQRDSKRRTSMVRWEGKCSVECSDLIDVKKNPSIYWIHPTYGTPVSQVPDEVLIRILTCLGIRDLCSSRRVCKRWYDVCSTDCLWDKFITWENSDLPRWLVTKHNTIMSRISTRYTFTKKGYEHFLEAVDAWWEHGQPHGKYTSANLCPLIRKVTLSDWCVFYEVLSTAFTKRADNLACNLITLLQKEVDYNRQAAGVKAWQSLNNLWKRYIAWVKLVSLHCADLKYAIRLESVRTVGTPSLYNKGVLCFRSQVILSYGLRGMLQAGLIWLSSKESQGTASEQDIELLCSLHHLLQELDVTDDFTLPRSSYTQPKLRRCFLDGVSSKDYSKAQIIAARLDYTF